MAGIQHKSKAVKAREAELCLNLHTLGMSQARIAQKMTEDGMPMSTPTVNRRIALAISLYVIPALEDVRKLELARLDNYLDKLQIGIALGDVNAIKAALMVQDRRAKMLGTDLPQKQEVKVSQEQPSIMSMVQEAKQKQLNLN